MKQNKYAAPDRSGEGGGWMKQNTKIGLVLSGGGAKGAYEAGVWAGLQKLGVTDSIDGIIGSSVGALNAVLFDTCDLERAEDIWLKLKKSDLLYFSKAEALAAVVNPIYTMIRTSAFLFLLKA